MTFVSAGDRLNDTRPREAAIILSMWVVVAWHKLMQLDTMPQNKGNEMVT